MSPRRERKGRKVDFKILGKKRRDRKEKKRTWKSKRVQVDTFDPVFSSVTNVMYPTSSLSLAVAIEKGQSEEEWKGRMIKRGRTIGMAT